MEISVNKYLHKKFKKQTNCVLVSYNAEETNTRPTDTGQKAKEEEDASDKDLGMNLVNKDNNAVDSVPNSKSTNCEFSLVSCRNDCVNVVDKRSSISERSVESRTGNLSATISDLKENQFNFDTKNSSSSASPVIIDKSSSLDTNIGYTKYLLAERPNGENEPAVSEVAVEKTTSGGKYVCTYCNLACSKPSVLQKHIRAHTNERPYPCVSCGFSFKTRSNLYKHCRSRTHANRVMGNKHSSPMECVDLENSSERPDEPREDDPESEADKPQTVDQKTTWEQKTKPYKPKFHTAKLFFEEAKHENEKRDPEHIKTNPDFLKLRINELINKNNSIVNADDAVVIRRRTVEHDEAWPQPDEPLNLSAKNRKRCLSDSENTQKSLIKELLLKNLSSDPNLQCQYCRMIFQSVPELEMHKLKYCNAYKTNHVRYTRSCSVNVASILTNSKNAYDSMPAFSLKSPGPCLGKTRLIENEHFSFDDNAILHHSQPDSPNFSKYILSPGYSPISPQIKKNPIKLFGGEVKITQTSGETKSYKIESESINKMEEPSGFIDFGSKMSENLVIKSSLHSGGTVLQTKSSYATKDVPSPNILRYDNANIISPSLNISLLNENKFTYDKVQNDRLLTIATSRVIHSPDPKPEKSDEKEFKSNVRDFTQKAIKLITPNLKPPNLALPGLPIPNMDKIYSPIDLDRDKQTIESFAKKQISLQQKMTNAPNIYNPVNLIVNGKVIPYVPGMPGPVVDVPIEFPKVIKSPKPRDEPPRPNGLKTPTIIIDEPRDIKSQVCQKIKMDYERRKEQELLKNPEKPAPVPSPVPKEELKKFARPNSLALKPTTVSLKSHHGLTPTMFNQALISPDTPRVAKKYCQQYLNGNYFSYLGLKSSTKSVYCTLNKTQPFYVKHFKKLSMYSEWRQQESKIDSLSVAAYDSRQRLTKYTTAGTAKADLIVHSSYKFVITETKEENSSKSNSVPGGYESNEDYTYIRGRGRGRYVCDQCGIRCKKPSMLKKHIRTHSDDRPYTCQHCNFSFKTKGNLTKHMKSKAHSKKYAETSSTSTQNSVTTSSESEDSDAESSADESTRLQDHEAAHCLLSLSQKNTSPPPLSSQDYPGSSTSLNISEFPNFFKDDKFLKNSDQITQVTNINFAKNKIMDETVVNFTTKLTEEVEVVTTSTDNISQYLGRSSTVRPLTYPYQQTLIEPEEEKPKEGISTPVIVKPATPRSDFGNLESNLPASIVFRKRKLSATMTVPYKVTRSEEGRPMDLSTVIVNESPVLDLSPASSNSDSLTFNGAFIRKDDGLLRRSPRPVEPDSKPESYKPMFTPKIFDLEPPPQPYIIKPRSNSFSHDPDLEKHYQIIRNKYETEIHTGDRPVEYGFIPGPKSRHSSFSESNSSETYSQSSDADRLKPPDDSVIYCDNPNVIYKPSSYDQQSVKITDYEQDQSAMQTLAEIAIKQMKTEKNIMAKNVASEYLKLALKNEYNPTCDANSSDSGTKKFVGNKESAEMIAKSEENKNCSICDKNFSKPSQLRLHMNIHYLERPFKCEPCSVSFRTKGHLQKHERSASHHNKLSTSPALSSSEPRPFKCSDCSIAFRIHGHLAKHLRSKMHIMKLECLAKIPFGLYAELERANSLLTEINTTDGELCLESLKLLAKKLFNNDPTRLNQLSSTPDQKEDRGNS